MRFGTALGWDIEINIGSWIKYSDYCQRGGGVYAPETITIIQGITFLGKSIDFSCERWYIEYVWRIFLLGGRVLERLRVSFAITNTFEYIIYHPPSITAITSLTTCEPLQINLTPKPSC